MTEYLLLSGELVDAPRALRTALVDRLLPAAEPGGRGAPLCPVLAGRSALPQRATKEVVAALTSGDGDGDAAEAVAGRWYRETITHGEHAEGVAAFAGRRPPPFEWAG